MMAIAKKEHGRNLGTALAEAIGIEPSDCIKLTLVFNPGDLSTITAEVIVKEGEEQLVAEGELALSARTWTEGTFKRIHMYDDARDDIMASPLYERIETEG